MAIVVNKTKATTFGIAIMKEAVSGEPQMAIVTQTANLDVEKKIATFGAPYVQDSEAYSTNRTEIRAALQSFRDEVYAEEDKLYL